MINNQKKMRIMENNSNSKVDITYTVSYIGKGGVILTGRGKLGRW